jgi:hypothetical protein
MKKALVNGVAMTGIAIIVVVLFRVDVPVLIRLSRIIFISEILKP